jgi:uncharacterized membrane protein
MSDDNQTDSPQQTPQGDPGADSASKPRRRRWLRIGLMLSLAFNLLFVGFATAKVYQHHWGRGHGGGHLRYVMAEARSFGRSLPRERRHELRDLVLAHRDEFRGERANVEEAVRALASTLGDSEFDRGTLETAIAGLQHQGNELLTRGGEVVVEVLMALTEEERLEFSRRLLERLE